MCDNVDSYMYAANNRTFTHKQTQAGTHIVYIAHSLLLCGSQTQHKYTNAKTKRGKNKRRSQESQQLTRCVCACVCVFGYIADQCLCTRIPKHK